MHIGRYAIAHARAAFGLMGADTTRALAKAVWAFALRGGQRRDTTRVTPWVAEPRAPGDGARPGARDPGRTRTAARGTSDELRPTRRPPGGIYEINPPVRIDPRDERAF